MINKFEIIDGRTFLNGAEIMIYGYELVEDVEDVSRLTIRLPVAKTITMKSKDTWK